MTSFFEELWARSVPKLRKLKRGKPYRYCTGIDLLIQIAKVSVTCLFCHCTLATAYSCKRLPPNLDSTMHNTLPKLGNSSGTHVFSHEILRGVPNIQQKLVSKKASHNAPDPFLSIQVVFDPFYNLPTKVFWALPTSFVMHLITVQPHFLRRQRASLRLNRGHNWWYAENGWSALRRVWLVHGDKWGIPGFYVWATIY